MDENVLRDLNDDELLVGYKNTGDNKFFQELFQRYQGKIQGACLKFFRGNHALAEDASQNTFAKALEKAKDSTVNSVAGWLFTMAKNCCIDIYRKQNAHVFTIEDPNNEEGGVTHETQDKNIEIQQLVQQINELSDKQRISLKLYMEGYSYQEIAEVMLYSEKEVKSAIQTGKENLKKFFKGSRT